jgi:flavin-dependent dehydrogenase
VILGGGRGAALGVIVRAPRQALVSMITRDLSASVEEQFGALLTACERTGVLTGRAVGPPESRPCVAGLAVDMDTHVGKRCLLIGDAGGFVASFSGEGIYPAMKSGWIAGQVAARAVAAPVMQDELSSFSAAWRAELADYLRMPNIDLTLLVPLIFTNPQMSRRVARAFLLGRSF